MEALLFLFVAEGIALAEQLPLAGEGFPLELSHIATRLKILKVNVYLFPGDGLC